MSIDTFYISAEGNDIDISDRTQATGYLLQRLMNSNLNRLHYHYLKIHLIISLFT